MLGVIVGGRLGYVFFYDAAYFLGHPLKIFAVWEGGMASHGGFIGVAVALLWVMRRLDWTQKWAIADLAALPAAIGLGLGRIGNFINQELYGVIADGRWGMHFDGVEGLRHPVQLYDAFAQWGIALLLFILLIRGAFRDTPGRLFGLFLILYGVVRFLLEYVREQHGVLFHAVDMVLSKGQLLTVPLLIIGVLIVIGRRKTVGSLHA